jgi:hypothetical protein
MTQFNLDFAIKKMITDESNKKLNNN